MLSDGIAPPPDAKPEAILRQGPSNRKPSAGSEGAKRNVNGDNYISIQYSQPAFVLFAGGLTMLDQLSDLWILFDYAISGHWGWFTIALTFMLLAFATSGLFVSMEEWVDSALPCLAGSMRAKFWFGFFQLHIPVSTWRGFRAAIEEQRHARALALWRLQAAEDRLAGLGDRLERLDPLFQHDDCVERRTSGRTSGASQPRGSDRAALPSQLYMSQGSGLLLTRMERLEQVRERYSFGQSPKQMRISAEWLRLIESLFEDIPGLTLQCYIAVLTRERDYIRIASILIGILSMSINVSVIFGEDQPLLRRLAIFAHVSAQMAMRTVMLAYLSVSQAEKAISLFVAYAVLSLLFSTYLYTSTGWVISNLFFVPLWFLAWDTTRTQNGDIFGWQRQGRMDKRTMFLRLMIAWRFLENLAGILLVYTLAPVHPCSMLTEDVRYLSDYCMTCCRGPIYFTELTKMTTLSSIVYALSWFAGWFLDNYFYNIGLGHAA